MGTQVEKIEGASQMTVSAQKPEASGVQGYSVQQGMRG
ncbi:hypothetical protein OESDEN_06723 [Oesophagostomum dentatum]|uniref:Uncharacterized protein n=1 Tax=Oesophagostomum dentatum TaxID=61180 RepID=A0A0B1T723_OESDE|nr:hypothetical protein OESDEN_06723 [Oesophagostomum dentatum]